LAGTPVARASWPTVNGRSNAVPPVPPFWEGGGYTFHSLEGQAFGAGQRSTNGDYLLAFITNGLACLLASLLVLRVSRHQLAVASAG
jgi:hypothetical protein